MGALSSCKTVTSDSVTNSLQTEIKSSGILTESLVPEPIEIKLSDLPEPYATKSARNPPNVIPVPENPILRVPSGFEVNVFADNLKHVRWMSLTPEGEVLAVQSRQNKINLLLDENQDGVAEVRRIFANSNNGLDQPLGMTFAGHSFYRITYKGTN